MLDLENWQVQQGVATYLYTAVDISSDALPSIFAATQCPSDMNFNIKAELSNPRVRILESSSLDQEDLPAWIARIGSWPGAKR